MPPLYRFQPEKRVGRLHRRGDRRRAWRQAADVWKREAQQWRRRYEGEQLLAQMLMKMARERMWNSARWFFYGAVLAGAAVMAFVK